MSEFMQQQKLDTYGLIDHMKSKGITFELQSESDAKVYLETKNNYLRVTSFRKLFPRHDSGDKKGQFINLEFDYLVKLSYIDQTLRSILRSMALDVEHYHKVEILNRITNDETEDGYSIVSDYVNSLNEKRRDYLTRDMNNRLNDLYHGELITRHKENMPVWVFLEVTSFGTFVDFCRFCSERWSDKDLGAKYYMLKKAKSVRNAASHGACIMNGFVEKDSNDGNLDMRVKKKIAKSISSKRKRLRWCSNPKMREVMTLIYLYSTVVKEGQSKNKLKNELNEFFKEVDEKLYYLPDNNPAIAGIEFIKSLTKALKLA